MADCNYRFRDTAGAWQTITGKPAMMAALVSGRMDHLLSADAVAAMAAPSAAAPKSAQTPRTPPAPAPNTIFTEDAAAKARELLRRKLGQLNSGLDPEMLQAGITLAGYHIEKGARSFSAYAQAMLADLGDAVRPYLKSWYMGVKYDPRAAGFEGMDTATTVEAADTNAVSTSLRESLYRAIKAGNMPKDNPALRKIVQDADGAIPTAARMKEAQEDLEAAIVMASRDVVAKKEGDRTTFDILLRLYESQPNLNIRTSTSINNQAYSTPAPLAFLTARLAGIGKDTTMYEPTAGNGMLAITATPRNVTATELDGQRFGNLQALGVNVTQGDALKAEVPPKSVDAVHTNPPFGPIKNEKGESIKVKFDGYTLGQIDHLIAARALDAMKDDGKASLIIGANKAQGQMSNNDLIFFNWLYGNYNVTTHFEVSGDLYQRQGAGWPVRVITINGRAKSDQTAPAPGSIARAGNWSEVYEQFQKGMDSGRGAAGGRNGAIGGAPAAADDARAVSVFAGTEAGQPDSGRPASRPQRAGNVAGAGPRAVGDRGAVPGEPVGQRDRGQRPDGDAAGADGRAGAAEAAGTPAKPAGSPRTTGVKAEENQFQSTYVARSARKDEGVLIPVNMAGPTQDALNRLEDEVGDIDEFVVKELGYPSIDALHDAFMGLQVDSIASAVYQIKAGKGIIIADQTGIGKGRQAAGIIRWAAKNGKIPVFVTVKPSLFTDMYGDLADIGTSDVDPFILNSNAWIKGPGDEKLFANRATLHKAAIERIATTGELPSGRNALFLTYSQINTDNVQRRAVMALAPNAVFVLDESHNAGGDSGTGAFVRDALGLAAGVTYLSATYAKRPDNMPVYFKTDIGDASADDDSLMSAMSAGGLPLQTVVANNLVKAGQMFRRERSYDGVSIESRADTAHRAEHVELSDSTTLALRAIVKADSTFHSNYVKALQKELEKQGSRVMDMAGNQAKASVDHTQFSSVVHNFVRQMLLGLKAQESADEAVRSLRRGEKPLIAVENTMGSFLAEYAENNNLRPGDSLGSFDYRTVLSRALERSRYIIRQLPNGDKVKEYIPLNKLDPISRAAYESAQGVIDELEISIPVSPIDWMRNEITKAGFSVAEVTGRSLSVDYSDPNNPKLAQIDPVEQKDKVRTTRLFNSGQLDALVLNVAGSTGISLHASEKFKDQRQRHMIVAQAAQDINIFMQMLGRIHRTGQVRLPKYTILTADLPAEIRPTALLSGKMKSLNANTSSNTKSATSVESADMLNKYGDQVVGQYLADNPELARALGVDAADDDEGPGEDIARKATGRLALMPVKVQEQFYAEVEEQYRALIDYLNKTNQNDLEPRTFDLDARELKSELLFEGINKASPFGEDAFYNEFSIKAQGKAMTPDEIRAAMNENLGGLTSDDHARALIASLKQAWVDGIENAKDDNGIGDVFDEAKFRSSLEAKKLSDSYIEAMVAANRDAYARGEKRRPMTVADVPGFGEIANKGMDFVRSHPIGSMFRVEINGDNYNAVVTNIRSTHKASGNPFSLSKFQVTIALNGALRSLTVPATQFAKIETSRLYGHSANIDALFRPGPTNERETAKIITGNLLGAYGEISESRGSIITFTKADGSTEQGILMPKAFNFAKDVRNDYRLKTPDDVLKFLTNSKSENIRKFGISSRDGIVRVLPEGARGIAIQVPKSKAKGGRFFLDTRLREHAGDFVSVGNSMFAYVEDAAKARMALDVLMQKQALYALPSMSEEARAIIGDAKPAATIAPQATPSAPAAPATSVAVVEHTTQNGKVLRGIVRTDLTKAEAQEVDPYTFKKDGGWFIREKHVKASAGPARSEAAASAPSGITAESLPAAFAQRFPSLSGAIKTMLDRGALGQKGGLVVLETNDETQIAREFADRTGRTFDETVQMFESGVGPEINGFYDALSGTTFLVGPNLDGDAASAVVMHEMVHGQQRRSLDEKSLALIQGRAKLPLPLGKFLTRVAQRMEDVGESNNATEAAAYIVEMAVQEGRQAGFSAADGPILAWIEKNIGKPVADLVREFVAMARAWALAHGVELKRIAVDDLVAYAKLGLKRAADGRVVTFGRESGSVAAMSEREGVAGKQAPTPSDSPDVKFSRAAQAALGPLSAAQQSTVERIFGKPKTLRERAEAFAKDWQKNLVQGIFDQFAPIKELTSKGYMLTRLAKGSDSTLEAMLLYGKVSVDADGVYKVDFDGKNLNGFAKTMAKLDGEHDRFLAWVSGQRAERLSQVGLENLMTPADIAALQSLADGSTASGKVRRALYADALKDLNAFNDSVLKIASDSGLIDEATREMYRDVPYVPFYRLSEEDVVQGPSVSKGLVNQSAWKRLKGGTNQLNEDLMGNLLKNWSHLITASANNRAAKEVLDTAARMGAATDMTNDVVAQDINGQPIYRGNTKGLVRYRGEIKRKIPKGQPYIENGQTLISDGTAEISYVGDRYFKVDDPHLMDAIGSIGFTTKVWKPMADFKRYLTFGVTVNPTFKVRNLIRDSIQAVGTAELSYNPVQNILMGAKGTAMMSNVRAQMLASGGMLRFGSAEGGYSGHVRRLIEKGVDPQYILDDDNKIKSFWKHKVLPAFEAYQELGDRSENVNRAALYEQLLTKGMSHAEASFWARDMMDFSMHGKWAAIRTLTAVVPFMNARLQGIYKLGRATKADYRRMGATLAAVSVASMALMLAYGDDDDWKKREDWDRDNSWWFKVGGVAFRIPKPFEVGAVGTIAERSLELLISDEMTGKRFGQRMRDLLMHNLSMNPTPQLIKPMIDLYANKDGFSGREIETQGMEKLRPEDRYTNRTSEVARFLGQIGLPNPAQLLMGRVEGLSPVQIDHLIRGYFSWVGTSATTMLDYGIRPMMDRGDRPDMRLKDVFLAGNFVESLPSGSSRYVTQLYEQAKEIEQMYASYQQAIKEGNTEKAQEIRADNAEGFAARRRIESAKRAQSLISGQMRTIERSKEMSGDEKRARLDQLEKQRDRLARQALLVPAAPGRD